ncbi:hypothetical protein M0R45_002289 [Rubus argutus]|uniref:Uncharacterized protein n=1 Tax=Rubus argutus TaxID=59490 RepID=A0AAW1VJV0_RUBAR
MTKTESKHHNHLTSAVASQNQHTRSHDSPAPHSATIPNHHLQSNPCHCHKLLAPQSCNNEEQIEDERRDERTRERKRRSQITRRLPSPRISPSPSSDPNSSISLPRKEREKKEEMKEEIEA